MKAAALWSGGKDSSLATYKAIQNKLDVTLLANFIWEKPSVAHALNILKLQAEALQKPNLEIHVKEPYFEEYHKAIIKLKQDHGIEAVVTGDITIVDNFHGNWVTNVCKGTGVEVINPLWEFPRAKVLEEIITNGFKPMFTCVKEPWFTQDWLGRTLDAQAVKDLTELHNKNGVDLAGEKGEYHTMVLDAPFFKKKIKITKFTKEKRDEAFYLNPTEASLEPK
jgi:diphthine-ammonia ligase